MKLNSFQSDKFDVNLFLSSTEILLDKLSKELQTIKEDLDLACPNCNNPARYNSHNEKFCTGCAMLVRACKCK